MKIHQGLRSYRLAPDQGNPREVAFAKQWELANSFNLSRQPPLVEYLIPDCTDRDSEVAATVIQWLGSEVGTAFLEDVIKSSPELKQRVHQLIEGE